MNDIKIRKINCLNISIDNLTMDEAIAQIDFLVQQKKSAYVVTPNLDHIVMLEQDAAFAEIYQNADLVVADGQPLIWISRFLKTPIKEKISGSDLFPLMCELAEKKEYRIFILGAAEQVAKKAAENLIRKYAGLQIVGTYSPDFGFENNQSELEKISQILLQAKPDILAVALGSPKGEKFIYNHCLQSEIPLSISIGATIDFEAGNVKRAPYWMRNHGLEWLYRITQDPKRLIKRYWNDAIKIVPIIMKYKNKQ